MTYAWFCICGDVAKRENIVQKLVIKYFLNLHDLYVIWTSKQDQNRGPHNLGGENYTDSRRK